MIESLRRGCRRSFLRMGWVGVLGLAWAAVVLSSCDLRAEELRWYKGCTHSHSFWSDGDAFPEMVIDWYKSHGYHFFSLTDHNCLSRGEKWVNVHDKRRPRMDQALQAACARFGDGWIETRVDQGRIQVRLKTLEELRPKFEEPGRFLLIEGEEITDRCGDRHVHICTLNLADLIPPQQGKSVAETIANNYAAVRQQAESLERPMLTHVNHPNWAKFDVDPEDLTQLSEIRFFEVRNSWPWAQCQLGDAVHPNIEKFWDVANTIRIGQKKMPAIFGIGSDDSHRFFEPSSPGLVPGRAWIMVRAPELSLPALAGAMNKGDFYASSGVTLRDLAYDAGSGTLRVEVAPEAGVHYTIEFIGTLAGADPTSQPVAADKETIPGRPGRTYSPNVGAVLARHEGVSAAYQFRGKELYVRAVVRSDKKISDLPSGKVFYQEAWCQPVGWEKGCR